MTFDRPKHTRMVEQLKKQKLTVAQIMLRYNISKPTAFRWLRYAKNEGHAVEKRGSGPDTTYHINNGD